MAEKKIGLGIKVLLIQDVETGTTHIGFLRGNGKVVFSGEGCNLDNMRHKIYLQPNEGVKADVVTWCGVCAADMIGKP